MQTGGHLLHRCVAESEQFTPTSIPTGSLIDTTQTTDLPKEIKQNGDGDGSTRDENESSEKGESTLLVIGPRPVVRCPITVVGTIVALESAP